MSIEVFISYSHDDVNREWLETFVQALQDRNLTVWSDEQDIAPGDQWVDELDSALRRSDAVVAVISGNQSGNPNIFFEVGAAIGANKRLILVLDPSSARSLPLNLQRRRWIAIEEPEETAQEVADAISAPG
ncbi:MAG TPA: toll/interleukin-1 receptor domain-containing protein [Pseudonocardiaceae bacterium]|nr:toll/interleukin-1 receptor domain-containing protein [Pseudonocardiaceae bacterium]